MSNEERETVIPATKQELFYYDEALGAYAPLVSDGVVPVYIVGEDGQESIEVQSVNGNDLTGRETKIQTPKQELFYYDKVKKVYKPLASNGAIPVYIVGEGSGDEDKNKDIDCGTF